MSLYLTGTVITGPKGILNVIYFDRVIIVHDRKGIVPIVYVLVRTMEIILSILFFALRSSGTMVMLCPSTLVSGFCIVCGRTKNTLTLCYPRSSTIGFVRLVTLFHLILRCPGVHFLYISPSTSDQSHKASRNPTSIATLHSTPPCNIPLNSHQSAWQTALVHTPSRITLTLMTGPERTSTQSASGPFAQL